MSDEETTSDEPRDEPNDDGAQDRRPDDTLAENKKCPECGTPVDDVRATCINCGYEYGDEDHEDQEAGNEFMIGSQVDDQGNELPDEEPSEDPPTHERAADEER